MQIVCIKERVDKVHCDLMFAHRNKYPHQRFFLVNAKGDALVKAL